MMEHGGNIYKTAQELGISTEKIIDFSASINPLGVPETVKHEIQKNLKGLCNYPDSDATELRYHLSVHHNVTPESIICGNGSTELIYLIAKALRPKGVLMPSPTFSEYERACRINSELRIVSYVLKEENNFEIDPGDFISLLTTQHSSLPFDMAFLCNPNNPTGRLLKKDNVLKIAEAAKELKCYLIVDEAFIDFSPEDSVIEHVLDNPYLIVLRSMTKFYALSGLRIGYGVFPLYLIERLKKLKEPWTVNTLAQNSAVVALRDRTYKDRTFRLINREKSYFENGFKKIGVKFFPSNANFYLLKINNANEIFQQLRRKGILVRDCSNFRGLDNTYIRVAVKSHKNNMTLMKEISRLLSSPNSPRGLNV